MLNKFGIDDEKFISKFLQYYAYAYGKYVQYESGTYYNCSENIYAGHKDNKKTFYNSKLNIACEPDYIFKDRLKVKLKKQKILE